MFDVGIEENIGHSDGLETFEEGQRLMKKDRRDQNAVWRIRGDRFRYLAERIFFIQIEEIGHNINAISKPLRLRLIDSRLRGSPIRILPRIGYQRGDPVSLVRPKCPRNDVGLVVDLIKNGQYFLQSLVRDPATIVQHTIDRAYRYARQLSDVFNPYILGIHREVRSLLENIGFPS